MNLSGGDCICRANTSLVLQAHLAQNRKARSNTQSLCWERHPRIKSEFHSHVRNGIIDRGILHVGSLADAQGRGRRDEGQKLRRNISSGQQVVGCCDVLLLQNLGRRGCHATLCTLGSPCTSGNRTGFFSLLLLLLLFLPCRSSTCCCSSCCCGAGEKSVKQSCQLG